MRKKIPTITRPDPAYAASLRPEGEKDPGREETVLMPMSMTADVADEDQAPVPSRPSVPSPQPSPETTTEIITAPTASQPRVRRIPATRKIDIRVNALERQEEALIDCGVDPAHVIRAALRRAVKTWQLGPEFVPPSEEQRTRITEWRARTSLAVDANALTSILHAHDPLDVLSKWALIRGQIEPRVWAEIDILLDEIAVRAAAQNTENDTSTT
ncbi:hypothetical protein [Puniceibacterium sp. IMCC21224]|uniref:hypothetical protein n=1 Tax=Puniceibacterium sp. IMCC21224 TaxID=1618204 RepID=UPI00064E11BE|nr:hypothetical protein [Puniceibacterium sp. IMCC21224]KMK64153.1 hypothetical protein IMCC21224_15131 [Puniceibacterium sp. IMCC21224]